MNETVAIIFSHRRPLQLDLTLKSLKIQCTDYENIDINVLCKVITPREKILYAGIELENPTVNIVYESNLRKQMQEIIRDYKFVFLITDDTIFVDKFNITDIINLLKEKDDLLGFSLRLGTNCEICYPVAQPQSVPECAFYNDDIILWEWNKAELDWNYPLELSSSIYNVGTIMFYLNMYDFINPNYLEFYMDSKKFNYAFDYPLMAAYATSRAFAAPVNKINAENMNRSGNDKEYSISSLLTKYENGVRIDPLLFDKMIPNACHYEVKFW